MPSKMLPILNTCTFGPIKDSMYVETHDRNQDTNIAHNLVLVCSIKYAAQYSLFC